MNKERENEGKVKNDKGKRKGREGQYIGVEEVVRKGLMSKQYRKVKEKGRGQEINTV